MSTTARGTGLGGLSANTIAGMVLGLTVCLYLALQWFAGVFRYGPVVPHYLVLHTAFELLGVVVAFAIFSVGWHAFPSSSNRHALFLAAAFLAIGVIDFAHALAFPGMPPPFTPNTPQRMLVLWLAGRGLCAAAFLASAFILPGVSRRWLTRPVLLVATLAVQALVLFIAFGRPDWVPRLYDPAGPPAAVLSGKIAITVTLGLAYAAYWRRLSLTRDRHLLLYLAAFASLALSDLVLMNYRAPDMFSLLGHLFKALAFIFVYLATVAANVRAPYADLLTATTRLRQEVGERERAEAELRARERQLSTVMASLPDQIVRFDREGRFTYVSPAVTRAHGQTSDELLGRTYAEAWPGDDPAQAKLMRGVRDTFETGAPNVTTVVWPTREGERAFEVRHIPELDEAGRAVSVLGIARDITDRQRARETIAFFDFALDNVHEAAFLIDARGRFRYVNEEACRTLGLTRPELLTLCVADIDPDFPLARWATHWQELQTRRSFTFEGHHRTRDGRVFPVEINANYFEYEGEGFNLALVRDITERARSANIQNARLRLVELANSRSLEELLRATLDELEDLTESTIGFYHFLEPDQQTLWLQTWSTNTLEHMCTAEGQGRHYDLAEAGVWADAVRQRRAIVHNDYAALTGRKGLPDGHAQVTREVVLPVFRGGRIRAIIGVGNKPTDYDEGDVAVLTQLGDLSWDIAEQKRAKLALEEQHSTLRGIIDSAPALVFSVDTQYRYTSFNGGHASAMKALYGADIELGRCILDFMTVAEDRATARGNLDRALAGEQLVEEAYSGESERSRQYFRLSHSPIRNEQGAVIGVAMLAQDLTQRRRAEERIQELNEKLEARVIERTAQLEAANMELEAFAYSVSHDLRAPLRHINGFVQLLQKQVGQALDETGHHYMEVISGAASHMGQLIDDLLAFSRMGRAEMSKGRVDLAALLQDVRADLPADEGRSIRWSIGALPVVSGDRAMLRIVLVNLLSNALKFTRPRAEAEIEVGATASGGGGSVVFVRDNGVGFDPAYASQLFGVFQRLHRVEEFEGTGIGLATVRRVVARHGGRTWAESRLGSGATFYFSLPGPAGEA